MNTKKNYQKKYKIVRILVLFGTISSIIGSMLFLITGTIKKSIFFILFGVLWLLLIILYYRYKSKQLSEEIVNIRKNNNFKK